MFVSVLNLIMIASMLPYQCPPPQQYDNGPICRMGPPLCVLAVVPGPGAVLNCLKIVNCHSIPRLPNLRWVPGTRTGGWGTLDTTLATLITSGAWGLVLEDWTVYTTPRIVWNGEKALPFLQPANYLLIL